MTGYTDVPTIGIGGPVGAGKTSLICKLVPQLHADGFTVGIIANDVRSEVDAKALRETLAGTVPADLIVGVESGTCIQVGNGADPSANLATIDELLDGHPDIDIVLIESVGDSLSETFHPDLADYTLYVISVAEGDDIPRKRGPGLVECDLLVVNKTDLADAVEADLTTIERDARTVRDGPFTFTNCQTGEGVDSVLKHIKKAVLFA